MSAESANKVHLHLWPQAYAVARLRAIPQGLERLELDSPPVCLVVGHGEVSLLAPLEVVERHSELVEQFSPDWRALTLDTVVALSTVGLLAAVSRALAEVGVPVMAFASHDTDHLLVPAVRLGTALAVLHQANLDRILRTQA
jgi:uncharacterized protein